MVYVLIALRENVLGILEDFPHLVSRPLGAISNLKGSVAIALKGCLTLRYSVAGAKSHPSMPVSQYFPYNYTKSNQLQFPEGAAGKMELTLPISRYLGSLLQPLIGTLYLFSSTSTKPASSISSLVTFASKKRLRDISANASAVCCHVLKMVSSGIVPSSQRGVMSMSAN